MGKRRPRFLSENHDCNGRNRGIFVDSKVISNKRRGLFRLVLGFVQMFGAAMGIALLLFTGLNILSLTVAVLTGITTMISIALFGGNKAK